MDPDVAKTMFEGNLLFSPWTYILEHFLKYLAAAPQGSHNTRWLCQGCALYILAVWFRVLARV